MHSSNHSEMEQRTHIQFKWNTYMIYRQGGLYVRICPLVTYDGCAQVFFNSTHSNSTVLTEYLQQNHNTQIDSWYDLHLGHQLRFDN